MNEENKNQSSNEEKQEETKEIVEQPEQSLTASNDNEPVKAEEVVEEKVEEVQEMPVEEIKEEAPEQPEATQELAGASDEAVEIKEEKVEVKEEVPAPADEASDDKEEKDQKEEEFDASKVSFGANEEDNRLWYVINTYSGYEDNVAQALKQRIDSLDMSDRIFDVVVPKEKKVEIKNGKKKIVEKKIFPGYVLVQMNVDEDSWYVVRNTPSVTGFIGFGNTPTPLSKDEVKNIQKRMGIEEPEFKIDYEIGESVKIVDGPFKDFDGVISDIDKIRGKIKVLVSMFGRETPVELDALQIQRI